MSYTDKDLENAIFYSNQRISLLNIKKMYEKYPNIASHLSYSINIADKEKDYYYPDTFKNKAILVNVNIPEKLCEKLSCNSSKQWDSCSTIEEASYYRVGDQNIFERVCQPACYNLLDEKSYDEETGIENTQMTRLKYTNKFGCVIVPPATIWFEQPYYRSQEHFEKRLNDLPLGFNRGEEFPYNFSGLQYEYNSMYCESYFDKWSEEKKDCIVPWYEEILYAVVGESVIKLVKAGIQLVESGGKSTYPDPNLPDPPKIEDEWLVKNWKSDIDSTFIVPDGDFVFSTEINKKNINKSRKEELFKPIDYNVYNKKKSFLRLLKSKRRSISSKIREKLEKNYTIAQLNADEIKEHEKFQSKKKTSKNTYTKNINTLFFKNKNVKDDNTVSIGEIIGSLITGLLEGMTTLDFWEQVGIGIITDIALDKIKDYALKVSTKIIPKLTEKILALSTKLFSKLLEKSIFATMANTVSKIVIKSISKVMIGLFKLFAELASVVGIILAILTIFDLVLSFWDPLGFNNKFDKSILPSIMKESDNGLRMELETPVPILSFDILCNIMLTSDEIIENNLNAFTYIYDYLDNLTVNSDGSRIDKGDEINVSTNTDQTDNDYAIAKTKIYTQTEFFNYENDHAIRLSYFQYSKKYIIYILTFAAFFLFLEMYIIALFVIILSLILVYLSYINTTNFNIGKIFNQTVDFMNYKF